MNAMRRIANMKKPQVGKMGRKVSRSEMIGLLRDELMRLTPEGTSACRAVAERGIFCRGFLRFTDAQLRQRFQWIDEKLQHPSRKVLEDVADRWQLARQEVTEIPLACDVQQMEHDSCRGWDDFSNADLIRFYREISGQNVSIRNEDAPQET
jgi:hypothetical protein